MDALPFAKRPPRIRTMPPCSPHKTFDPVIFHSPENKQQISDRIHQEGALRQVEMKADPRYVDGRLDQVTRNRMNMFADLGHPIPDSTRVLSPPLERATKHGYTPYTYSTRWINHPDSDTNLAARPDAMIPISQTNWADEMISEEHRQTGNHMESIYDALRHNDRKFHDYVGRVDAAIKTGRELNWKDIRAQREAHWKALEARQRLEKIKSYD